MQPSLFTLTSSTGALATATCPLEGEFWATVGLQASWDHKAPGGAAAVLGPGLWDLGCANRFLEQTPGTYPHPSQEVEGSPEPGQWQLNLRTGQALNTIRQVERLRP